MTPPFWVATICATLAGFLKGENGGAPQIPEHYFDRATENLLAEIGAKADLARYQDVVLNALPRQLWRAARCA
jgi:hypothetical protein